METRNRVSFSIESIREEKFELTKSIVTLTQPLRVMYLIETEINPNNESVYVRTGIRYKKEEDTICECILGIQFAVDNFSSVVTIDEESRRIHFNGDLMPTLWGITYGALRGALFEKVKNTFMEPFPLPLISAEELENMNRFKVVR